MKKLLFILSVFVFFACGSSNSPEKVLEQFVKASYEGTISENTSLVANDDGTPLSEKAAKELVNLIGGMVKYDMKQREVDKFSVDKVDILNVEYNEAKTKAKVQYLTTLNGKKGEESSTQYLIKNSDGWKIVVMVRGTDWLNS